jgi:FeS assembly SUF system regulator
MIRITRQTDYGIVILAYLATRPGDQIHTARDVAAGCRLPLPMVSKILKALAREGILLSHRGVKGGYSLGKRPDELSVAGVIQALEGPIGFTECAWSPGSCEQESGCPTRVNWQRISHAIRETLERIPLAEMVGTPRPTLISLGDRSRDKAPAEPSAAR